MALERKTMEQWDPYNKHVAQDVKSGKFVASHSVLVAAGPPRLENTTGLSFAAITPAADGNAPAGQGTEAGIGQGIGDIAFPIGLIQNATVSQAKQLQRLFEVGSYRSYFVSGRTIGTIGLGTIMYHGPSLLRSLMAFYNITNTPKAIAQGEGVESDYQSLLGVTDVHINPDNPDETPAQQIYAKALPGSNDYMFSNLGSDIFEKPVGLLFLVRSSDDVNYGAFYCEDCYIQTHNMSFGSGQIVIMEGVQMQFDRVFFFRVKLGEVDANV
jgi:hypothetical protein